MLIADVIRAAIPDADDATVDFVIWSRTPFPMREVSARDLYRAASRLRRAAEKGLRLCDHCDRLAGAWRWTCVRCEAALKERG